MEKEEGDKTGDSSGDKAVLVFCGGGQAAVFGAGCVRELNRADIHDDLDGVVGASSGLANALAIPLKLDPRQMFLDFTSTGAASARNTLSFFVWGHLLTSILGPGYVPKKQIIDVPRVIGICKEHGVDLGKLRKQTIKAFVRVLNVHTNRVELIDINNTDDPDAILQAAILCRPYCNVPEPTEYMDAVVQSPIGIAEIRERFPTNKIVVVTNMPRRQVTSMSGRLRDLLLGLLSGNPRLLQNYGGKSSNILRCLALAESDPRIHVVHPPEEYSVGLLTEDPALLREGYEMGRRATQGILDFLESPS